MSPSSPFWVVFPFVPVHCAPFLSVTVVFLLYFLSCMFISLRYRKGEANKQIEEYGVQKREFKEERAGKYALKEVAWNEWDGVRLCQACKMGVYWGEATVCGACKAALPKPRSTKFMTKLHAELVQRNSTVAIRSLDGTGRVVHQAAGAQANSELSRIDMCNTLTLYAFKHGWAAWGLGSAIRELRGSKLDSEDTTTDTAYVHSRPIEDDFGPMGHWCSCDNQKHSSSNQAQFLASEVLMEPQAGATPTTDRDKEQESKFSDMHLSPFIYQWMAWTGATRQITADAIWLAGSRQRRSDNASRHASQEVIKGSRGTVETVLLHHFFMNSHVNVLDDGLALMVLGAYPTALDHGRVQESDFTLHINEVARYPTVARFILALIELAIHCPQILDWNGACLSTLGLIRGLTLRAWEYACHWNALVHWELRLGPDWEEQIPWWTYIASALAHDIGDLCSDTRRGCAVNSYYGLGAHAGYEGVAACMDIIADALEAVVLQDTQGAVDIGLIAGSACTTFERTGGMICVCPTEKCEAETVLNQVSGSKRIEADDAATLIKIRDELRLRCRKLPLSSKNPKYLEHEEREKVYAEATRAMAAGSNTQSAHDQLQVAYSSVAKAMCGELRRRAARFRLFVASTGQGVLDLSNDSASAAVPARSNAQGPIPVTSAVIVVKIRKVEELEGVPSVPETKRRHTIRADSVNDSRHASDIPTASTPELPETERYDDRFASNELVSPSIYLKHTRSQRGWLFLAPTSTWSFSRRILNIIQSRLNPSSSRPIPLAVDGDAHQLQWRRASSDETPDISGLPSLEHALYIVKTVQFHFGPLYRLFDEGEFLRHLYQFYDDAASKLRESRLWYVQFLVVLAFGEAFLSPVRTTSSTASWTKYFTRAMSLLPDITSLWQEPTLAIELLALIALYFHSVDMRDTAYCYIGHSIRMALVEGLHRTQPVEQLGQSWVNRRSNIWWTVYILDRKFSALIGSPNAVNDEEITSVLWDPKTCSQAEAALSLHVKISQVISRVINSVYNAEGKLGGVFLRKVQSILREMTDLVRELEDVFSQRFSKSIDALSNVTTRLTLSCHLCIIVTTRPLVLCLLGERLNCFEEGDVFRTLSAPVRTLLQACTDSAMKSLKILTALREQNLLETFLPFDLENLFSSFFILSLLSVVTPDALPDSNYREMGFNLLNDMVSRGNRVAQLRKSEMELLEELVQPLKKSPSQDSSSGGNTTQRPPAVTYFGPGRPQEQEVHAVPSPEAETNPPFPSTTNAIPVAEEELLYDWRDFGVSLDHMLSAADQLNANNSILDLEHGGIQTDLWLWSDG